MTDIQIRNADYADIPALTKMFMNAYCNNEAMQAALRKDEVAEFAEDAYWRFSLGEWGLKQGEVYCTAELDGSLIMIPPGNQQPDVLQKMELWAIVARMMGSDRLELAKDVAEQMLSGPTNQDCYWLWGLGVDPASGGKGIAKALINHVTDMADNTGKDCYVVASSEKVVKTFERRGFFVLSKSENFPYWFMLRSSRKP